LNEDLSTEITLQPLKRFDLDAAIIFSDILMLPYGLNQKVEFEKGFGPKLGEINIDEMSRLDEIDFVQKIYPVYKAIQKVSSDSIVKNNNKNTIGFVGAPWTLLVYIINQQSPKKSLTENFFKNEFLINRILLILEKFLKIHIKNQIDNGANVIQIFDSWAGLLEEKDLPNYIYSPTLNLVNFVKSLNTPVICFPREIKNYKEFCEIVKPDAIGIDYNVDPRKILNDIKIPIQGGLDPKILLTDKERLKKEATKYLDIFKDHPYIFNLGHGVLPETDPNMFEYLVNTVKDYK
jgi:uroporphyrinogen decarboxylase